MKVIDLEVELDRFLKIKTNGRDDSQANFINYPYEATPYCVLQTLANSGYINKRDKIIDFGCGKGRVGFYLSFATKAKIVGIEFDERLYNAAKENHKKAISANRVEFFKGCASSYVVDEDITGAYFFNPFSIEILEKVIDNLMKSKAKLNRKIKLFFYYPSHQYLALLSEKNNIKHLENIDCTAMFDNDEREYIAVYEM